jgi:hypothetical protein
MFDNEEDNGIENSGGLTERTSLALLGRRPPRIRHTTASVESFNNGEGDGLETNG